NAPRRCGQLIRLRCRLRLCNCKAASGGLLGGSTMIRPPRRSVTRFFIPLIDVLILLFCIFLLMPIVEEGASGSGGAAKLTPGEAQVLRQRLDELQRQVAQLEQTRESPRMRELQEEVERLRQEAKVTLEQRLLIRTFQIDPKTGALTYADPDRVIVRDQA